jgi:signal transduction histidine kinase
MENAVRHSRAKSVKVSVSPQGSSLELRVCDDGVGFDRDSLDDELHFGMQMISERVEAAGGWLLVDSKLGEGTRVCASIPSEL